MNLPFFIARHYLFSKKQKSVINIISIISMIGVAVSTAALIIVLSVFNGIGNLTQSLFNIFDPQILIEPSLGKTIDIGNIDRQSIQNVKGIRNISLIAEENAWVTYKESQAIVQLRGVDGNYGTMTGLDTLVHDGPYTLKSTHGEQTQYYLIVGGEIDYRLGLSTISNIPISVHIPKRGTTSIGYTMEEAFNSRTAYPAGTFYIQQDIDSKYIVCDIDLVRELLNYTKNECTSIAIALDAKANIKQVKKDIKKILGTHYTVKDRFEQQPLYYKIFKSERLGIILILSLIIVVSTFTLISSLSLLIIDKSKDIRTMKSMGMTTHTIRTSFFTEGVLISVLGIVTGLTTGFIICYLQQQFGIIKMGDGNFIVEAFPVAMKWEDFLTTFTIALSICAIAVGTTTRRTKL